MSAQQRTFKKALVVLVLAHVCVASPHLHSQKLHGNGDEAATATTTSATATTTTTESNEGAANEQQNDNVALLEEHETIGPIETVLEEAVEEKGQHHDESDDEGYGREHLKTEGFAISGGVSFGASAHVSASAHARANTNTNANANGNANANANARASASVGNPHGSYNARQRSANQVYDYTHTSSPDVSRVSPELRGETNLGWHTGWQDTVGDIRYKERTAWVGGGQDARYTSSSGVYGDGASYPSSTGAPGGDAKVHAKVCCQKGDNGEPTCLFREQCRGEKLSRMGWHEVGMSVCETHGMPARCGNGGGESTMTKWLKQIGDANFDGKIDVTGPK